MSIREHLNERPAIRMGVPAAIIACLIGVIVWQIKSGGAEMLSKAFYTDDDGKTWFVDRIDRVSPFDHNGKKAVRCYVYECQTSGKRFVGYMEKFTDQMKVEYERAQAEGRGIDLSDGRVYKKPGAPTWVSGSGEAARTATLVECPDNPSEQITIVSAQ